jgi:hypothetical protein
MSMVSPSVKALLVGVPLEGTAAAGASYADVLGWHRVLRSLGVPADCIRVVAQAAGGAREGGLLRARTAELEAAQRWISDADHAIIAVSGPGTITAEGREALQLSDGAFALERLSPAGVPRVDWFLDLCRTKAGPGGWTTLPGHVCHWACAPGERANQRRIGGRWRGVWTWAVHTVLEQWTTRPDDSGVLAFDIDHRSLARRAAALVAAIGEDKQHSGVLGDAGLQSSPVGPGLVEPHSRPTAPVVARETEGGWGIILDGAGNCVFGIEVVNDNVEIRFGSSISSASQLPANGTLEWRSPSSSELAQLASPAIDCTNQIFSAATNGPGPSGGRLYSSQDRLLYIKIKGDLSVVAWFTEEGELNNNYLNTGIGSEGLATATAAPSAPSGGWHKAKDS